MPGIDLHTHSTASDGTLSPTELISAAKAAGLDAIALTDHDTAGGLQEAAEAGKRLGVEVIPGCELSVTYSKKPAFMHILGLYLPVEPKGLTEGLEYLNKRREDRNIQIVQKLRDLGISISYEELLEQAGDGTVGRPHFAQLLIKKGVVPNISEAFSRFLGDGGKAYLPKEKFDAEKAIPLLKAEGASVVLAHPYSLHIKGATLEEELTRLKEIGLDGIECLYPLHSEEQTKKYIALAEKLDLLVLGGSDFHGDTKPDIKLGVGTGKLNVPYELLEKMKDRRRAQGLPV
jgi:hypothetical protein